MVKMLNNIPNNGMLIVLHLRQLLSNCVRLFFHATPIIITRLTFTLENGTGTLKVKKEQQLHFLEQLNGKSILWWCQHFLYIFMYAQCRLMSLSETKPSWWTAWKLCFRYTNYLACNVKRMLMPFLRNCLWIFLNNICIIFRLIAIQQPKNNFEVCF